jgi:sialate O-acetylesterase
MIVAGQTTRTFGNILVGGLWIASGQSNMEFSLKEADNGAAAIAAANAPDIRLFKMRRDAAAKPKDDVLEATGRQLRRRQSPISPRSRSCSRGSFGSVTTCSSGLSRPVGAEHSWMSVEALQAFPQFHDRLRCIRTIERLGREAHVDDARSGDLDH